MEFLRKVASAVAAILQSITLLNNAAVAILGTTLLAIATAAVAKLWGLIDINGETLALYLLSLSTTSLFLIVLILAVKYRVFRRNLVEMIKQAAALANNNTNLDKTLFHDLFVSTMQNRNYNMAAATGAAGSLILTNMITILDGIARLYRHLTGHRCCVTVKTIIIDKASKQVVLKTAIRDTACANARKHRDLVPQNLSQNDEMAEIYFGKRAHFADDNLLKSHKRDQYHTSRTDWREYYNATLVVPIHNTTGNITALLCIDNFEGGLNNTIAIDLALYLTNRLAIMLYRASVIEEIINSVGATSPKRLR
jgi:hypothetical protein